jgi:hypothetical protein
MPCSGVLLHTAPAQVRGKTAAQDVLHFQAHAMQFGDSPDHGQTEAAALSTRFAAAVIVL